MLQVLVKHKLDRQTDRQTRNNPLLGRTSITDHGNHQTGDEQHDVCYMAQNTFSNLLQ